MGASPREWIRTADGRIFEVDCFGHEEDHTLIGKQSIVWDLAGLVVEWQLSRTQIEGLTQNLVRQGVCLTDEVLQFYEIAYAAFRMGLCNFCGRQATDVDEKARLAAAEKSHCHKLVHLLLSRE